MFVPGAIAATCAAIVMKTPADAARDPGGATYTATGTSLAALLLPVGLLGAWVYWKDGNVDLKAAGLIAVGLALGVFLGAKLVQQIEADTLRRMFAVFLAAVAVKVWFS